MSDPLRVLVVHPGASSSVSDVHSGLVAALRQRPDIALAEYALGGRLSVQSQFLHYLYRRTRKRDPETPVPTPTDVVKRATYALPDACWRHQADWLLAVSGMLLHPDLLGTLRWLGRPRLAVLLTESPYDDEYQRRILPFCDLAWTNERCSVATLRAVQPALQYLPHAYNPSMHFPGPIDPGVPRHDVVFVGTGFIERVEALSAVDWTGIDLGLYGNWWYLGSRHRLRRYLRGGETSNALATALYRNAKIGLNFYRQSLWWGRTTARLPVGAAESLNPRAYELAACGCFSISDWRPEVTELFGSLVPTFGAVAELEPLLRQWLADEAGRAAIAAQLPMAVARESWTARAGTIVEVLQAASAARRVA